MFLLVTLLMTMNVRLRLVRLVVLNGRLNGSRLKNRVVKLLW